MSKTPSLARIGYLDPDKSEAIDKSMRKSRLERDSKETPGQDTQKEIDELKKDIKAAEDRFRGRDQEHKIFTEGSLKKELGSKCFDDKTREGRIELLHHVWCDRLKKERVKERHVGIRSFILSPDGKQFNALHPSVQKEALKHTINRSMDDFRNKYLGKSDNLTYAYSFHMSKRDKDGRPQPHAHIYLYPYSDQKKYISMNAGKYDKSRKDINLTRKTEDKFMLLTERMEHNFEQELIKTKEILKDHGGKLAELEPAIKRAQSLFNTKDRRLTI